MAERYAGSSNPYWAVNFYWTPYDPNVLQCIDESNRAERLMEVANTLPLLVVAAVFHSSRHNLQETVLSSWMVCEALLEHLWKAYISNVGGQWSCRKRLRDHRTYSANVQAEVLLTAGLVNDRTYDLV
jgi:hypothetical protein